MGEPTRPRLRGGAQLLRYSSLGIEMGAAIAIGLLVGIYLDRVLGTKPWLTILFFLFGIAAGFKNIVALIARGTEENGEDSGDD